MVNTNVSPTTRIAEVGIICAVVDTAEEVGMKNMERIKKMMMMARIDECI